MNGDTFGYNAERKMALGRQEGGQHYRGYTIQPVEYIVANGIGFLAGNVIKYATRYRDKNGAEDIRKAIHYLELILEFEYPNVVNSANGKTDGQDSSGNPDKRLCTCGETISGRGSCSRCQRAVESFREWHGG